MYGKLFASMFTGSMMAAGPETFAVWSYVVANVVDSTVELNPKLLAAVIGSTPKRMQATIDRLCCPDVQSRSKEHGGRRLVKESEFLYRVVNHEKYRGIRGEDDRRDYERDRKRKLRAASRVSMDASGTSRDKSGKSQNSAHTDTDTEALKDSVNSASPSRPVVSKKAPPERTANGFEAFWTAYPRRVQKKRAVQAFAKVCPATVSIETLTAAIAVQSSSAQWLKDEGKFAPYPATWLNDARWLDEPPASGMDAIFARGDR